MSCQIQDGQNGSGLSSLNVCALRYFLSNLEDLCICLLRLAVQPERQCHFRVICGSGNLCQTFCLFFSFPHPPLFVSYVVVVAAAGTTSECFISSLGRTKRTLGRLRPQFSALFSSSGGRLFPYFNEFPLLLFVHSLNSVVFFPLTSRIVLQSTLYA